MPSIEYITTNEQRRMAHDFIALRGLELAFEANRAFDRRDNNPQGICHFNAMVVAASFLIGPGSDGEHSPLITSPSQAETLSTLTS